VLPLVLIVARWRRRVAVVRVIVEITEGDEEGALLGLGFLEVLLLERLLIESSLRLVLAGGVLALVLALAGVILVKGVLVLLGAVSDEVVRASIAIATLLQTTTTRGCLCGCCETTRTC
jgi:hypothetical protein